MKGQYAIFRRGRIKSSLQAVYSLHLIYPAQVDPRVLFDI